MNIVHIALAGAYTEGMTYQEVMLSDENLKSGHNVTVIASCHEYHQGKVIRVPPQDIMLPTGKRLIRIPYCLIFNRFISEKIRKVKGLYKILEMLKPDVIFYHDIEGYELLTVSKYKKNNQDVNLYVDTHSDKFNSARNFLSKYILHKGFYHIVFMKSYKNFNKIFYISEDTKRFLIETHHFKKMEMLEYYPLGGKVISSEEKKNIKMKIRNNLKMEKDDLLFVHSGKITALKRTLEILQNLDKLKSKKIKLVIIGSVEDSYMEKIIHYIDNKSILYLGWKNSQQLLNYIAAADLYLQPGTQSAVMQNALCVGTPVLLFNYDSHKKYDNGNVFLINNYSQMYEIFKEVSENPGCLSIMSDKAFMFSEQFLNYRKLAERITLSNNSENL